MEAGRPSQTAHGAAMLRAAHQVLDAKPLILEDAIALSIIGPEAAAVVRSDPARFQTPERRGLRAYIAMRSRYVEDQLAEAVARGVRQYVILGAGLDTFAFRNPHAGAGVRVFEVDHPATQGWKRKQLEAAGIAIPDSFTFVPVDFESQDLAEELRRSGFNEDEPAFFSWLGVAAYLTRESVMKTLGFVASSPAGSEIVFTIVVSRSSLAERTEELGEPWLTYFDPKELASELRAMGFSYVEEFGPEDANRRYFQDRKDGLRVRGGGRLITARR